jgi:dTDP-4-dehydrorhamnose 3,5-epimerase
MEVIAAPIEGLLLIKPKVYNDERGVFFETFNRNDFKNAGLSLDFVQDNQSVSAKHVLRGLHFQVAPYEQGKLVRVASGEILDVAVDIRKNSKTYLKHYAVVLDSKNNQMLWIPPGFAHGFLVLKDDTVVTYKCTAPYNKEAERGIRWNDPEIGIDWGINNLVLSDKDKALPFVKQLYAIS